MNQGWIKLHRKLLENAVMKRSAYFHIWVTLLLKANHKQTEFVFNNQKMVLEAGQLVTGLLKLEELTSIPKSTIERILKYLEKETQIETRKTNSFTVITIKNWHSYQADETQNKTPLGNSLETNGKSVGTYNNVKNDKNEKNEKNYGGGSIEKNDLNSKMEKWIDEMKRDGEL